MANPANETALGRGACDSAIPGPDTGNAAFTTTHWSVVLAAGDVASAASAEALASLCRTYWRPMYAYVRRRGYEIHDAQDLVQAFFERAIEMNYVGSADRERGRFRTFLLASLEHFLAKEWKRGHRLKRGGGQTLVSFDVLTAEEFRRTEPADDLSPEKLYDRRWALTVLECAMERLHLEYSGSGRNRLFDELAVILSGDRPGLSYVELGTRLEMTEGAVKVAVHRLRQRYAEFVRLEVAETVSKPEQVEEELQHLIAALAR